ncbi:MAG: hypothetical protein AB7K24_20590 [Gemmataceae bacterium]
MFGIGVTTGIEQEPMLPTGLVTPSGITWLQFNDGVVANVARENFTSLVTPRDAVMMGTPDFMAPEQALDFHTADIRADIYSLGCTLYYALTGQPPFPGGSMVQKLWRHQQAEPPDVRQLRPEAASAPIPPVALEAVTGSA